MPNKQAAAASDGDDAADYDPQGPDHGLMELKTEAELAEQMRERGFQFNYACYQDGNSVACHSLGQWLSMWRGNSTEGAAVFKHNCDKHAYAESCFKYANYKYHGPRGFMPAGGHPDCNPAEGEVYYERGCTQLAHRRSCLALGLIRVAQAATREAGLDLLRRGCLGPGDAEGTGVACVSAAVEFGRAERHAEARGFVRAACDAGDAVGCTFLSQMLQRGRGGPADPAEAEKAAQRAKDLPTSEFASFIEQSRMRSRINKGKGS